MTASCRVQSGDWIIRLYRPWKILFGGLLSSTVAQMFSVPDHRNHPWCFQNSAAMLVLPVQAFSSGCWHKWFSRYPPPPMLLLLHLQQHSLCILTINNWLSFSLPCFTSASMYVSPSLCWRNLYGKANISLHCFWLGEQIHFWWCFVHICFAAFILFLKLAHATPLYCLKH